MLTLVAVAVLFAPPFQRLVHMPAAIKLNVPVIDRCLDEAKRMGAGISFNAALMDASGFASTTDHPRWDVYNRIVDGALERGLPKVRIIMGGGPPPHRTWKSLNAGDAWSMPNRPPRGEGDRLWAKLAEFKQSLIDMAITKAKAKRKNATDIFEIQLWTEPGKGGSGGPWVSANPFRYNSNFNRTPEGTWDDLLHEQLNFECSRLDFRGLPVFAPSFEVQSSTTFAVELRSASSGVGSSWRSKVTVWPVSIYGDALTTFDPEEAVRRFADKAVSARSAIRTRFGSDARVVISEYGWTNEKLKAPDNATRGSVLRACEAKAASLGFESACLYTIVDDAGVPGFGLFDLAFKDRTAFNAFNAN